MGLGPPTMGSSRPNSNVRMQGAAASRLVHQRVVSQGTDAVKTGMEEEKGWVASRRSTWLPCWADSARRRDGKRGGAGEGEAAEDGKGLCKTSPDRPNAPSGANRMSFFMTGAYDVSGALITPNANAKGKRVPSACDCTKTSD